MNISVDSKVWSLPVQPYEVSFGVLPYTIQSSLSSFQVDKTNAYSLRYGNIMQVLRNKFHLGSESTFAYTVEAVGVYGITSTMSDRTHNSVNKQVALVDAYTGRMVSGLSTPVDRARAGFIQAPIRQMYWYSVGNRETSLPNNDIAYLRIGNDLTRPLDDDVDAGYHIILRGKLRVEPNNSGAN